MSNQIFCFIDVDGCISKGPRHFFDLTSFTEIHALTIRKNIVLVLISGRSQPYLEAISQTLGIKTPYICENGSAIYDPLQRGYIFSIKKASLLDIETQLKNLENCKTSIEPGKEFSLSFRLHFNNIEADIYKEYEYAREHLNLPEDYLLTHSSSAIDIVPANVNKGTAAKWLARRLGFDLNDCRGFGDAENDIPFLHRVGKSGAPNNATDRVKNSVDFVSDYNDISGLIDFLNSPYF